MIVSRTVLVVSILMNFLRYELEFDCYSHPLTQSSIHPLKASSILATGGAVSQLSCMDKLHHEEFPLVFVQVATEISVSGPY